MSTHGIFPVELAALLDGPVSAIRDKARQEAESVDRNSRWPEALMSELGDAGLLGLHVPKSLGGKGMGLLALAAISENLGQGCASLAMCFGMHCVGSAVIVAKATSDQQERYLRSIAKGEHVTTLALSESGTGSHFYLPGTKLHTQADVLVINGSKQFVTNGGHADSYVVSTQAMGHPADPGRFSCLIVDRDLEGMTWEGDWAGVGMRGNASRNLRLNDVKVPSGNLLGQTGDQIWYVFEVVAPYFLMSMAGTYLGIASAALDFTKQDLLNRTYSHTGDSLAANSILQHRLAELHVDLLRTRSLVYQAGHLGDMGAPEALSYIMASKVAASETAVRVVNEAMTLCGGRSYRDNSELARLLRDARASHVMSPTTDMLKTWIGRTALDLPLL